jgi:hypothetical protein
MSARAQISMKPPAQPVRPVLPASFAVLSGKCACGGSSGSGGCDECRKKKSLQRSAVGTREPHSFPPIAHLARNSPGQSPDPETRASFEPGFGHDFSKIRVHEDVPPAGAGFVSTEEPRAMPSRRPVHTYIRTMTLAQDGTPSASTGPGMNRIARPQGRPDPWKPAIAALTGRGMAMDKGDGITLLAQGAGKGSGAGGGSGSGAGSGAPAPSCTFSITYANVTTPACTGGRCGAEMVFDITEVRANGSGCPNLDGLTLTEVVTNDHGCVSANVEGGPGCPIESKPPMAHDHGRIKDCTDTYEMCAPASVYPATGCTETITQKLFVGGTLAETHSIKFRVAKSGGSCSGTATRT